MCLYRYAYYSRAESVTRRPRDCFGDNKACSSWFGSTGRCQQPKASTPPKYNRVVEDKPAVPGALFVEDEKKITPTKARKRTNSRICIEKTAPMQFFSGWERATKALPPASLFLTNKTSLGPVMVPSRTIDRHQSTTRSVEDSSDDSDSRTLPGRAPGHEHYDEKNIEAKCWLLFVSIYDLATKSALDGVVRWTSTLLYASIATILPLEVGSSSSPKVPHHTNTNGAVDSRDDSDKRFGPDTDIKSFQAPVEVLRQQEFYLGPDKSEEKVKRVSRLYRYAYYSRNAADVNALAGATGSPDSALKNPTPLPHPARQPPTMPDFTVRARLYGHCQYRVAQDSPLHPASIEVSATTSRAPRASSASRSRLGASTSLKRPSILSLLRHVASAYLEHTGLHSEPRIGAYICHDDSKRNIAPGGTDLAENTHLFDYD
ncbi:hypothetical protein BDV96DRAFT_601404 [Lophiotrema nucula]|uniref:Uncharacterized protein n=1 Tax=Lophiotrema nucula TaxID=690887 RepID=A0A6A5Z2Y2_9PLEO|nr:hypothetical protein BDV96DRAFT_601404 [Lophiotrema nucula]